MQDQTQDQKPDEVEESHREYIRQMQVMLTERPPYVYSVYDPKSSTPHIAITSLLTHLPDPQADGHRVYYCTRCKGRGYTALSATMCPHAEAVELFRSAGPHNCLDKILPRQPQSKSVTAIAKSAAETIAQDRRQYLTDTHATDERARLIDDELQLPDALYAIEMALELLRVLSKPYSPREYEHVKAVLKDAKAELDRLQGKK